MKHSLRTIITALTLLGLLWAIALPQPVLAESLVIDRVTVKQKAADAQTSAGILISFYTSEPTTARVDFGTTTTYERYIGASALSGFHELVLVGLKSNTTYRYRISVRTISGTEVTTLNQTFKTSNLPPSTSFRLEVRDVQIRHVGGTYIVATWTTLTPADSELQFNTVESFARPAKARAGRNTTQHEVVVGKLKLNTRYYYRVYARDKDGNEGTSDVHTVTTAVSDAATQEPLAITEVSPVSQGDARVTDTSAIIRWRTSQPAKGDVGWRTNVRRGKSGRLAETGWYSLEHQMVIADLKPATSYVFVIGTKDIFGRKLGTGEFTFTTKPAIVYPPPAQVAGASTICEVRTFTYGRCRDARAEQRKALEVRAVLNRAFRGRVPASARANWYTLVNAATYGAYPAEALVAAVKHGGKTVHPTIAWSSWKNSQDYQAYISK